MKAWEEYIIASKLTKEETMFVSNKLSMPVEREGVLRNKAKDTWSSNYLANTRCRWCSVFVSMHYPPVSSFSINLKSDSSCESDFLDFELLWRGVGERE